MILTLADVDSVTGVQLKGPGNLEHVVAGCREFIFQPGFQMAVQDICESGHVFQDEQLKVEAVLLNPECAPAPQTLHTQSTVSQMFPLVKDGDNWAQMKRRQAFDTKEHETTPFPVSVSYICQGPDRLGKLDLDKLSQMGIRPGPAFGKLIKGESVTVDGRTVHPSDCVSPGSKGPVTSLFICVEIPDFGMPFQRVH